jgi:hypothetical protein
MVESIFFVDDTTGWAVGYDGRIFYTTDGGINWNDKESSWDRRLTDVFFIDKNIGWIVGISGILATTNGGVDWSIQKRVTLESVFFIDQNTGWAVGSGGKILKTSNGGVTFIEDRDKSIVPQTFLLNQNFPNPFNPSTKINYSVPHTIFLTLKIFDILGREVAILINEEKHAGRYELEFDGANLPSGVYFYQLQAGDFVETKKMVLLR